MRELEYRYRATINDISYKPELKAKKASNYKQEVSDWLQDKMILHNIKVEDFNKHPKKEGWYKAKNEAVTLTINYKI